MDSEKERIHCAGCGKFMKVPDVEKAKAIEGILYCSKACVQRKKTKMPLRGERVCQHQAGWFIKEPVNVFVFEDGKVSIDGQHGKHAKLRATCNIVGCQQPRNVFIEQMIPGRARVSKNRLREK